LRYATRRERPQEIRDIAGKVFHLDASFDHTRVQIQAGNTRQAQDTLRSSHRDSNNQAVIYIVYI
jgi:hypothetical protein